MFTHVAKLSEALELLGLDEDCSLKQLKFAYKQHALRTHPDKNPENPDATAEFQRVGEAYKLIEARLERSHFSAFGFDQFYAEADEEGVRDFFYDYSDSEDYDYDCSDDTDSSLDDTNHHLPRDFMKYWFLFEAINRGYYRRDCSWHREETPQEFQARLKRSREEQVAAEARRAAEAAARKERKAEERERERVDAERRKKVKAENKRAQAEAHKKQVEEAVSAQQKRTQELRSVVFAAARAGSLEEVKDGVWKDGVDAAGGELKYEKFAQNIPDDPLETLLHIAAKKGSVELFQWLDAHSAEMDERDSKGYTALHFAIYHGHIPMVKYVFENYPPKEPEHKPIYDAPTCSNLVYLAVRSGEPELVWMVLENGVFNAQDIKSGLSYANQACDVKQEANDSKLEVDKNRDISKLLMRYGELSPPPTPQVNQAAGRESRSQVKKEIRKTGRSGRRGQSTTFGQHEDNGKRERPSQLSRGRGQGYPRRRGGGLAHPRQTSS